MSLPSCSEMIIPYYTLNTIGYNFELKKVDSLGINCDDLRVQHFRDGHSPSLPLAARIIGLVDRHPRMGSVYGLQVRFEVAAHGFLIGHVYDFRTGSQGIEIAVAQLRRPLGRLLLIGDIADRFERIILFFQPVKDLRRIQPHAAVHTDGKARAALPSQFGDLIYQDQLQRRTALVFLVKSPWEAHRGTANNSSGLGHVSVSLCFHRNKPGKHVVDYEDARFCCFFFPPEKDQRQHALIRSCCVRYSLTQDILGCERRIASKNNYIKQALKEISSGHPSDSDSLYLQNKIGQKARERQEQEELLQLYNQKLSKFGGRLMELPWMKKTKP